jgi:hypothetical protein
MHDFPREVLFDRALRNCKTRYSGRQDPDKLEPSYRKLARELRDHLNGIYETQFQRVEGSGARTLYFDFIDSSSTNAIAFRCGEYAFVGVTAGFLHRANEICFAICHSAEAIRALGLTPGDEVYAARIFSALFSILLQFVAAHELGHHFHGHVGSAAAQGHFVEEEVTTAPERRAEDSHVAEIEADGYAVKLVMTNISGDGPRQALANLLDRSMDDDDFDEIIERVFVAAVVGYFHVLPQPAFTPESVDALSHPPRLVRLNFLLRGLGHGERKRLTGNRDGRQSTNSPNLAERSHERFIRRRASHGRSKAGLFSRMRVRSTSNALNAA